MSQQQDLRTVISNLPAEESFQGLQDRLDVAGLETDLSAVAAERVPETFVNAMQTLLEKPVGDLTLNQIRAITAEVNAAKTALAAAVTAKEILDGFKPNYDTGIHEFTAPEALKDFGPEWVSEAGRILNAAARAKGLEDPVFEERNNYFWSRVEADTALQTIPGKTYTFKVHFDSIEKDKARQIKEHGNGDKGAPNAVIALADACERLKSSNQNTLLRDQDGEKVWVRGLADGASHYSHDENGCYVHTEVGDERADYRYAFASLV